MANLQIHLLGGLQIRLGDGDPPHFVSSKAPALLAYLAVTRRPHRREALAGLLWGEMPDDAAANNLRQALSSLRKAAEPHLRIDRDEVAFNADAPYFLDVELFSDLLRLQRGQPPAQGIGLLRRALSLYQGEFLAGFHVRDAPDFEEWVLGQRVQLRDLALDGLESLTRLLIESGQCQEAIPVTAQLLALDPWREEAHRWRMLALARCRQTSAALAQYRSCRAILRQEFDADPSAETTALYERIRAAQNAPRHNLPGATTGFVGREEELAALAGLLAHPANRLLTLLGPGGVGKTRLALEVARSCEPLFLNGVCFLSLAPDSQAGPEQLAQALAQALNCPLAGSAPAATQVVAFLRSKEMLLVLDNLEEWLEAATWLSRLLAQAPEVKILATSRQRLDLQAERVFPLQGLPCPAPEEADPAALAAAQLFVRRAQRVQPDFALAPGDCPALARICRAVQGLPLGIELAAAWAHQLSPAEIAAAIERSFDFLATTRRDVSPRQRSLRAVFDWSWGRLNAEEQQTFARLAIFPGPFTRAAAQEVAEAGLSTLAGLADKSLVWRRGDLYQLHQVAQQFGREKLEQAGGLAAAQTAHGRYYARFLARQAAELQGHDQQAGLDAIAREEENVAAAWRQMAASGALGDLAAATDGLYHFLAIRSRFHQGVELFAAARRAAQPLAAADPTARGVFARSLAREGRFLSFLSRYAEAKPLLHEGLAIARELNEAEEMAFALNHLGGVARMEGDLALAGRLIEECLALRRQTGSRGGQAVALLELAGIAFMAGEYAAAISRCQKGLPLAEEAGDRQTAAHLLTGLSLSCRELGEWEAALDYGRRGQAIYEDLGDRYGIIQAALTLGELSRRLGQVAQAREFHAQAVRISQEIGFRSGEADGDYRLGQIEADAGEVEAALSHFRQALTLAYEIEELPLALDALLEIGLLQIGMGDTTSAWAILSFVSAQPQLAEAGRARLSPILAGWGGQSDPASRPADLTLSRAVALAGAG